MNIRRLILAAAVVMLVASCDNATAPVATDGKIVLRFESGSPAQSLVAGAAPVALFDSVVVNVFRSGPLVQLEVSRGAIVPDSDPIEVSVGCIAENNKKVGVNLYINHALVYHGFNDDVDVVANQTSNVTVDASAFYIPDLTLTPGLIPDGAAFTLHWPPAPAATAYRLEESATLDFAEVLSTESVEDTTVDVHVNPGSHFFRVRPTTPYATGPASPPRFGYVTSGSNNVTITGVDDAVIPGENITITGENLDFPGVQVTLGARQLTLVSVSWGEIVAHVPKSATTGKVTVTSSLGSDTSNKNVVVQRIAYVTAGGEFASSFVNVIAGYSSDVGESGVVPIPVADLDTRDMSVFDIIIVANDTGDTPSRWAGNPSRYSAITTSGAGVLAVGEGGASFMRLAISSIADATTVETSQTSYYTNAPSSTIFTTPHSVTSGTLPQWIDYCPSPERTIALVINGKPAGLNFYAETGLLSPNRVLFDVRATVRYIYWGHAADPAALSKTGQDCLGNALNLLYAERPVLPAALSPTVP